MPAKHIPLGEPAHDAERNAIRHLVDNLPGSYTVWSNAWLTERNGAIHELDAVVAAPHAVYIVEIKSYRGSVEGNENDWYLDDGPIRSPLRLNRVTAQKLKDALKRDSALAGQVWVEGLVFLSHATRFTPVGHAAAGRVHLRSGICAELQSATSFKTRNGIGVAAPVDGHVLATIGKILQDSKLSRPRPSRRIREYRIETTLERNDRYAEHLCTHDVTQQRSVVRVYNVDRLLPDEERARIESRFRWEATVLARVSLHPHVLHAHPAFSDEPGFCLPLEYFVGVTLGSWIDRYKDKLSGKAGLRARVHVWQKIASAIAHAHQQGVVHRMLRPEAVYVQDQVDDPDLRVGGFALAKQLNVGQTLAVSTLTDDRLKWSAPEVVDSFSAAEPASDQFGLGLLLGWMLAGGPLFESTQELRKRRGAIKRVREVNPFVPQSLDDAVQRMLSLRAADRFPTLDDALTAVRRALEGSASPVASVGDHFDPENIPNGTRLGADYEVQGKLGAGGLATVYAALHLVSGVTRALKVARAEEAAEEALQAEYKALRTLDHRSIVKVVDLSKVVRDRLTLVMERVHGQTLARWLLDAAEPDAQTLRRYAEDLFGALAFLEEKGITHKDIKPDNLIVGEEGLTVIDFSLVRCDADAMVGTALYRDPTMITWDHAGDRYAAALCLFELFTGRHPFDGHAPEPEREPALDDVEPEGLASFFERALSPRRERRPLSALAMRHTFLEALGQRPASTEGTSDDGASKWGASLSLSATPMPGATIALLRRIGIVTQGELVAAGAEKVKALPGVGNKKRRQILAVLDALKKHGVGEAMSTARVALWPSLVGDDSPTPTLGLTEALYDTLSRKGYLTVGSIAQATRAELTDLSGVTAQRITAITEALQQHETRRNERTRPTSVRALWHQLSGALKGRQADVVAHLMGIGTKALTQGEAEAELGIAQGEISTLFRKALEKLNADPNIDELLGALERTLDASGGILLFREARTSLRDVLPESEPDELDALLRLLEKLGAARFTVLRRRSSNSRSATDTALLRLDDDLVLRPRFTPEVLEGFLQTVLEAARWRYPERPPQDAEAVRRSIRVAFPDYQDFDPIALARRITDCVRATGEGMLYEHPIDPAQAVWYVTRYTRRPLAVAELWQRAEESFTDDDGVASFARLTDEELARLFHEKITDCRLEGDQIVDPPSRSLPSVSRGHDALPIELRSSQRTPEQIVADLLRGASRTRGYRMLVVPPENHAEIARSVVRALGQGTNFVSFEHELLAQMEPEFGAYERAERFKAQRSKLTRAAEALFDHLLSTHGRPGNRTVLGDTAILGLCEATHLFRRLYDETQTGSRGFWVVVVPGVILERQPRFNESTSLFHVDGTVLPVMGEIG